MKTRRARIIEDIAFIIAGPIAVAIGALIQEGNDIPYPPGDPRGEPGYGTAWFIIALLIGTALLLFGVVRLVMDIRARDKEVD
jgi:uncharacterized membrane protein HdeD (DUF308 family)